MSVEVGYRILPRKTNPQPIPQADSAPLSDYQKKEITSLHGCAGFALVRSFRRGFVW